ncbi:hypothetical protein N7462_009264 [Penicillium macrosclerotiorum]|uniref:uncharacterized protein n=1 Tax=Penicillium macrosclerotiorum TaxID=303699 RepID=UPI002547435D|nr:uncharacterized protein N7462_009264 [Penicillium macrosclerotiorum]KAJ5673825.1 hypothetical protein N7462_009264 [Penicillium macrosclerotiorum]
MAGGSGSEAEASGLVNTLQGHVDEIRSLIQCGICIRPLYEPFTLACGHTFCYTCLSSWFGGGRSKRTCPDCRAPVKTQPAPAYLVRAVVQMFTSRAELLDKGETTAEHSEHQKSESDRVDKDKADAHPQTGGLFGGLFKPKAPALKPLVDVDDGVMRCPHCQWELEDDACGGCGWVYRPDEGLTDYSITDDDYYDETDFDSMVDGEEAEEDEFGDLEDDDSVWGSYGDPYAHQFYLGVGAGDPTPSIFAPLAHALGEHAYHPHPWGQRVHDLDGSQYDEEEEDDDYDDMDSFIDDEEHAHGEDYDSDHSTVVDGTHSRVGGSPRRGLPQSGPTYVDTDNSDEDSEIEEDESSFVAPREPWEVSSPSHDEDTSSSPTYHDTRSSPMHSLIDDEDDEDDDEEEEAPHLATGRRRFYDSHPDPALEDLDDESASSSSPQGPPQELPGVQEPPPPMPSRLMIPRMSNQLVP